MFLNRTAQIAFVASSLLFATACHDDDDDDNGGGGVGNGAVAFSITDTPAEEVVSLQVDVTDLQMRRSNGTLVDALNATARVDLAALRDLSALVDVSNFPNGSYQEIQITFDFTNAELLLVDQSTPATLLDGTGAPLTGTHTVSIAFDTGPFIVIASQHHLVELDFVLDHSLIVDTVGNTVIVEPMFTVNIDNSSPKDLIATGRLQAFDNGDDTFVVRLETLNGTTLSDVEFHSGVSTAYQIDGEPFQGATGFDQLVAMPLGTWVEAHGRLIGANIIANYVEAGQGTFDGGQDYVEGVVVDRSGAAGADATLTVLGNSLNAAHTATQFDQSFTVAASFANTRVVRHDSAAAFDLDDINVGQKVRMYGQLAGVMLDVTNSGIVRTVPTAVYGLAAGASSGGVLTINLDRVEHLDETNIDWSDGGTTPPDPLAFTMLIGTLDTGLNIAGGSAVRARGFFAAVDDGQEDLVAQSLSNLDTGNALLKVRDLDNGFTVVTTTSTNDIVFDISGTPVTGEFATLDRVFLGSTALPATPQPTVIPPVNGQGLFFLKDASTGQATFFKLFEHFTDELDLQLAGGAVLTLFAAEGTYDTPTNTMTAPIIVATIE